MQVTAHSYEEAEQREGPARVICDVDRLQRAPKKHAQDAAGAADEDAGKKGQRLQWYTTLIFDEPDGFQPGMASKGQAQGDQGGSDALKGLPTVQLAPAVGTAGGEPAWGSPVDVYQVPSTTTIVLQGKMEGKGKAGKVEKGYLLRWAGTS